VEIDQVALVDASGRGVDDDEHLGGKVFAIAVEDDARNVQRLGVVWAVAPVEIQRRQPVLSVDDEVLALWLLQMPYVLEAANRLESQSFGGEEQHRAGNRR